MLHEEVQQACLRERLWEMFKDLLSHQVAASALCRKMECGLLNHIFMDETAFVRGQKIILLIFKYLECVFCVLFLDECLKIILPISNNHTTNLQISVMRELSFVSASLPKVRASIWEIILLISE